MREKKHFIFIYTLKYLF